MRFSDGLPQRRPHSGSRLLANIAGAKLLAVAVLLPQAAWAQETNTEGASPPDVTSETTDSPGTQQPATESQAPAAAGTETSTDAAPTVPDVVVEQEIGTPSETETTSETASETAAPPAPARTFTSAPAPITPVSLPVTANDPTAGFGSEEAVEQAIFGLPVDGGTLRRGPTGVDGYFVGGISTATKTNTLIMNIPGSVSIITEELARDQGAIRLDQALLYVPGITIQGGEGHRDQLTIRGQSTNADFFFDGVRDDIQTFRDLYNIQAVEVLKGPNAMIFGRGGGGGVINRVSKRADGIPIYEGTLQFGSFARARGTVDVGDAISPNAAVRLNAMYTDSETFRDFSDIESYGINPTFGLKLGDRTFLHLFYEYRSHDQNVDRGGPSFRGRPFNYPIDRFFGQPAVSLSTFDGHIAMATLEHETLSGIEFRNHTFFADYDKLYQNAFAASPVNGAGRNRVVYDGYLSDVDRQNFVNQTDLGYSFSHGEHFNHNLVAGIEVGVSDNFEFRQQPPSFFSPNSGVTAISVPVSKPTTFTPTFFNRPLRRNDTTLTTFSAYIQDQFEITRYFELIGGIRFDHFDVDFSDQLRSFTATQVDDLWSPRIGGVIKPWEPFHVYLSYSNSFLPSNGDNFGALPVNTQDLEPEEFTNYEVGFKWELRPNLLLQGALYQLNRDNQPVLIGADAFSRGRTRTVGQEIELSGYVTDKWQVFGGYSHIDSEVLASGAADNNFDGNTVQGVPEHTFSMWNRYQLTEKFGVGLGIIYQSSHFAQVTNDVEVPGYTRFDSAVYYDHNEHWSAQVNIENMFDTEYFISSTNDNNIHYGAPASAYVTLVGRW